MLYNIIKQLQETSSTNDKLAIMQANSDNELFREYMRLVTCPSISFYVTAKTLPEVSKIGTHTFQSLEEAGYFLGVKELSQRHVTGQAARNFIIATMEDLDEIHQQLYKMLLLKDIRAKIGVTLVNKVWPHLCVDIPYQRCSLPDEKTLKKFNSGETFIVQTKGDGMFSSLVIEGVGQERSMYTRNGSKFPKWVGDYIAQGVSATNCVFEGELLCLRDGKLLSRQEGNGVLNSVMQGADIPQGVSVEYHVWNNLPLQDWKNGSTSLTYDDCFLYAKNEFNWENIPNMCIIHHWWVDTLQQAYEFNRQQLAQGLEGSIIKTRSHKWKSGTSRECLKLKLEVEIDLEIVEIQEATGKDEGCAGRVQARSSCGKLETGVNCNGTQESRMMLFQNKQDYIGKIFTCTANDLVDNELKPDKMSLFLARSDVYNEIRIDKDEADSLERISAIFNAAKGIV